MLTVHLQQLLNTCVMQCKQSLIKNISGNTHLILKPQDTVYHHDCLWVFLHRISRMIAGRLREAGITLNPGAWWANNDGASTFCQKLLRQTKLLGREKINFFYKILKLYATIFITLKTNLHTIKHAPDRCSQSTAIKRTPFAWQGLCSHLLHVTVLPAQLLHAPGQPWCKVWQ